MVADFNKHLDRARRSLERNKLREAVAEYQLVLKDAASNQEALQALADIHTRLNEPSLAAQYYGMQFDRLLDMGDSAKAAAVFSRFLRPFPQPADRLMRYAHLLQKQNHSAEALEQFGAAADQFVEQQRAIEALACYESMAALDPENSARHVALAELAECLGHADLAGRSFLRAGQLTLAAGGLDQALEFFGKAHSLLPNDRTGALLFAEAKLRKGDAQGAAALLEPFAPNENDTAFLTLFGESLLRAGRLDHAREVLEAYHKQNHRDFEKWFQLIEAYARTGEDAKAAALLVEAKHWMRTGRRDGELAVQLDRLSSAYPASLPLAETVARIYDEMNRESKYFDALVRLFDLYLVAGRMKEACEALDRLVDIDPYDYRNHERIAKLEGNVDPVFLQNVLSRAAKAATVSSHTGGFSGAGSEAAAVTVSEEARAQQTLEDLIVQVEIFLQYSLQAKAVERLERIGELFAGEEDKNERLRALYERASWWPKGAPRKAVPPASPAQPRSPDALEPPATPPTPVTPAAETRRDLAAIAEINRLMYRQSTPRELLSATAAEIGKYLGVTRCLIAFGAAGEAPQITAEYFAPGNLAAGASRVPSILAIIAKVTPDPLGSIELQASSVPDLRDLGFESALAVVLTDKETQGPAGAMLVGDASARKWKPNESFFLQAVGDQLVLSVSHTRLRSLVRSLAVADERTGLLSRSSYIDCLLMESNRARSQGTPLSLIIVQADRGGDLLRQHGDAAVEKYVEHLAHALSSSVRQTDIAIKYTAWSLVFVLPNTSLENATALAEKLRQTAAAVRPSWGSQDLTVSAIVAEASSRPGDENEDRITEWINRAEAGLDEARQRGGNALVPLATP
jgi:diguanylate cyclase (GGDEF)-like protein